MDDKWLSFNSVEPHLQQQPPSDHSDHTGTVVRVLGLQIAFFKMRMNYIKIMDRVLGPQSVISCEWPSITLLPMHHQMSHGNYGPSTWTTRFHCCLSTWMSLVLYSEDYGMILHFATTIPTAFGPLGPLFIR